MKWFVVSPYFATPEDQWISDSVSSDRHSFELVPRIGEDRNWHASSAQAGLPEWGQRMRQAHQAFAEKDSGIITVFPQLAASAGAWKFAKRSDRPILSWLFNTENIHSLHRRTVARLSLRHVDQFVVHSTREIESYAKLLNLPTELFNFVPQQYGAKVETDKPEGQDEPYVFATGSGYRDYGTFFGAVEKLGYKTLVLASDRVLEGLTVPKNVTILEQITRPEIRKLVRHARVNVVPLNNDAVTAGIVTIIETFRHGRSLVATERGGIEDYVVDGETAITSKLFDANSMAEAIEEMWSNDSLRAALDKNAEKFADENLTDEVAGQHLVEILDRLS